MYRVHTAHTHDIKLYLEIKSKDNNNLCNFLTTFNVTYKEKDLLSFLQSTQEAFPRPKMCNFANKDRMSSSHLFLLLVWHDLRSLAGRSFRCALWTKSYIASTKWYNMEINSNERGRFWQRQHFFKLNFPPHWDYLIELDERTKSCCSIKRGSLIGK